MRRVSVCVPMISALAALAVLGAAIPASGFGKNVYTVGTYPSSGGFLACYRPALIGFNQASPIGFFAGSSSTLTMPSAVAASAKTKLFYVADFATNSVDEWSMPCPLGELNEPPTNQFSSLTLPSPSGIAIDVSRSTIYVSNSSNNTIAQFDINASGSVSPKCVLSGGTTGLDRPEHIVVEPNVAGAPHPGYLYVANAGNASITIYPPKSCGNVGPKALIEGSLTQLQMPVGIDTYFDGVAMDVYVADRAGVVEEYRDVFSPGNRAPIRVLGGSTSMLLCPWDVRVAKTNFDVYVVDPCQRQIDVFRKSANFGQSPVSWYSAAAPGQFIDDAVGIWLEDRN